MYFSEFLETCTIGWASFCEGGVGMEGKRLFYFGRRRRDSPPPPGPLAQFPPGGPSAPGQTAQHRQQRRPCQMQARPPTASHAPTHTPKRWTRCAGRSGRRRMLDCLQCVRQSVQFRTFIFIHIYMDIFCQKH